MKRIINILTIMLLVIGAFVAGIYVTRQSQQKPPRSPNSAPATNTKRAVAVAQAATSTLPPTTPLATFTPSRTLKPPPTLEPATQTLPPSPTTAPSATPTLDLSISIPGLRGAESPTPTLDCTPRKDWKLEYEIQRGDALATIAQKYDTYVSDLVKGNCLTNPNVIVVGQKIRVPGTSHPVVPSVICEAFDALTPFDGTMNVDSLTTIVFNWHGPRSPRTLLRVTRPDGSKFESVVELRQNETVDASENLAAGGTYKWQLFPLDNNFVQVCPESKFFVFSKGQSPTPRPVSAPTP